MYTLTLLLMCLGREFGSSSAWVKMYDLWEGFVWHVREGIGNYEFSFAEPIFKIVSLNLFSTKPTFRYREVWNFETLTICATKSNTMINFFFICFFIYSFFYRTNQDKRGFRFHTRAGSLVSFLSH